MSVPPPPFLVDLVDQLRRRAFPLGPEDLAALRQALAAGFGWSSRAALESLCVALWAKSPREADVVRAAFLRVDVPDLELPELGEPSGADKDSLGTEYEADADLDGTRTEEPAESPQPASPTARTDRLAGLPPLPPPPFTAEDHRLVLVPRYPVTEREVAQAWRRVRRPVRVGPAVEVDVDATIGRRSRTGVVSPPVLVARRRNSMEMLVFIDVNGSMRPYEDYVDYVCRAMRETARFEAIQFCYFHNVPAPSPDRMLLDTLSDPFSRRIDEIFTRIGPLPDGRVYADRGLASHLRLADLLNSVSGPTGAVVISDAGAARGRFDSVRLIDSIAFLRTLREYCGMPVWLNPTPVGRWAESTAGQLYRHVPMFPLAEKSGLDRAVEALRGRPEALEHPL